MNESVNILLVEDDDIDVMGLKRAFRKLDINNPILCARDGVEALAMLRGEEGFAAVERPYIVLLDINMPRMNGIEFLRQLRADEQLRDSIVFVVTTSRAEEDKAKAYALNVAGYIVKANQLDGFLGWVAMLRDYWTVVELPKGPSERRSES